MADSETVRNIVGYADYIHVSHPYYNDGLDVRDNVRYLADHGVKVILQMGWFDVWPFQGVVNGWQDMHMEDVVYGMNATEAVKYRTRLMLNNIGSEYVWGVVIGEEEPGSTSFPWPFVAWYLNLFYDWLHTEFPSFKVLQFPSPHTFLTNPTYHVKADGVVFDDYNQGLDTPRDEAAELKQGYPDVPFFFYISSVEHIGGWLTCHTSTYTKNAIRAISPYADVIGFWMTTDMNDEGWEVQHPGYMLALKLCNEIHLLDSTTVWGSTEWFWCDFQNDSMTDSLDHWYTSYFYSVPPDSALSITSTVDRRAGEAAVNLTCQSFGQHSFWWQPLSYDYYFADYPDAGPYGPFNMSTASRITYWVRGIGWDNHAAGRAYISIEKDNAPLGKPGNMTLPDITSLLTDGEWHRVDLALPLDPSMYYLWNGYGGQVRVVVDYSSSPVSDTTSILLDGWEVQCFDTGKACNLVTSEDYVNVTDGVLHVVGNAYFEAHFPQTDAWYWERSGTGSVQMLINGSWTTPPDEGVPCRWNASAIRLFSGVYDWVKVNAIPPLVEIASPLEGALLSGATLVEVNATDASGILRVEFALDGSLQYTDNTAPFTWIWNTMGFADGVHGLNATAYATSGAVNFHDIEVVLDNTKPSVAITAPCNNSLVQGSVSVTATASDASGIAEVVFYADGGVLAIDTSPPYDCLWNTVAEPDGARNLTCATLDNAGNRRTSFHRIVVDNTGPSVAVHSLLIGDGQVLVAANATDASGIELVEFYFNGALNFTDYEYPYQWTWLTAGLPDGSHVVRVVAYDSLGQTGFVETGVVLDRTLPTASVTRNPSGSPVRGVVDVTAVASDVNGIAYVQFFVDAQLESTDFTSPYLWSWDTRLFGDGAHTLLVVAVDNYGNARQIQSEVTVDNSGPLITLNSPVNGSLLEGPAAVSVVATVADPAGIQGVLLSYSTGGLWTNLSMIPSGANYQGIISTLAPGLTLRVRLYANDTLGNRAATGVYTYYIVDHTAPTIGSPSIVPSVPSPFDVVMVSVSVTDASGVSRVLLAYRVDAGAWTNLTMSGGPLFWRSLPAAAAGSMVAYRIFANDTLNQWSSSPVYQYTVAAFDVLPPTVHNWWWSPLAPNETDAVTAYANATDPSSVAVVTLSYHDGSSWHNVSATLQAGFYVGVVPPLPYGTTVTLKLYACDGQGNWGVTPLGQYLVQASDRTGPVTTTVTWTPVSPYENESILVTAAITDGSPITLVLLSYTDGMSWRNLTMQAATSLYSASIPAIGTNTTIHLRIFALDDKGNWGVSDYFDINVRAQPPPVRPPVDSSTLILGGILGGTVVGAPILVAFIAHKIRGRRRP